MDLLHMNALDYASALRQRETSKVGRNPHPKPTLKTWKASNWMDLDVSLSSTIMSFRFSASVTYRIIVFALAGSSRISPSSCGRSTPNWDHAPLQLKFDLPEC